MSLNKGYTSRKKEKKKESHRVQSDFRVISIYIYTHGIIFFSFFYMLPMSQGDPWALTYDVPTDTSSTNWYFSWVYLYAVIRILYMCIYIKWLHPLSSQFYTDGTQSDKFFFFSIFSYLYFSFLFFLIYSFSRFLLMPLERCLGSDLKIDIVSFSPLRHSGSRRRIKDERMRYVE